MKKMMKNFMYKYALKIFIQISVLGLSVITIMNLQNFSDHPVRWKTVGYFILVVVIFGNLILTTLLFSKFGGEIRRWIYGIPLIIRIVILIMVNVLPAFIIFYSEWGSYFTSLYLRMILYLIVSGVTALLLFPIENNRQAIQGLLFSFGISAFVFALIVNLSGVRTTPFSLSWSEGNRFYDYSLTFGKSLYQYSRNLTVPYNSPGRYLLWGSLFLIPDLPIWLHRLWDALLWAFTPVILMVILAMNIKKIMLRLGVIIWGTLFIMQGPVYPHLIVPMIILMLFIRLDKLWLKIIIGVIISYFVGISRFTWAILPGIWLVIYDLIMFYPKRMGSWSKKLIPTTLLGLAGIIPGVVGTWWGSIILGKSISLSQPLLLYRLLPNSTYGLGILFGAVISFLPLVVILVLIISAGKWKVNIISRFAMIISLGGLFILGLVASTKIGGGSNLHNLDMFILTLVFIALLAITNLQFQLDSIQFHIPNWLLIALIMVIIVPGWASYKSQKNLPILEKQRIINALQNINKLVTSKKVLGEILFIDQRQLLTFGYIKDVPLIPEYEKKYMMDQAMGNNAQYFEGFYTDLKNKRFKLIISDIQKTVMQNKNEAFSEENNAYIKWVSIPILNEYKPILTIKQLGIQLLEPRK
jgi:hypothetical protein